MSSNRRIKSKQPPSDEPGWRSGNGGTWILFEPNNRFAFVVPGATEDQEVEVGIALLERFGDKLMGDGWPTIHEDTSSFINEWFKKLN